MCTYCYCGDHPFKYNPPWKEDEGPWSPYIPQPLGPITTPSWELQRLKDYLELLKQIKELEDKIGCPCEPNKADYLALFEKRIKMLEMKQGKTKTKNPKLTTKRLVLSKKKDKRPRGIQR